MYQNTCCNWSKVALNDSAMALYQHVIWPDVRTLENGSLKLTDTEITRTHAKPQIEVPWQVSRPVYYMYPECITHVHILGYNMYLGSNDYGLIPIYLGACTRTVNFRLLFTPYEWSSNVRKGAQFESYFETGVYVAIHYCMITSQVFFQIKIPLAPGDTSNRKYHCIPDVIFAKEQRAAVVELKNYNGRYLSQTDVTKTWNDMKAVACWLGCKYIDVVGYMYISRNTKVSLKVENYANENRIMIVREGAVDAHELAQIVDRNLEIDTRYNLYTKVFYLANPYTITQRCTQEYEGDCTCCVHVTTITQ